MPLPFARGGSAACLAVPLLLVGVAACSTSGSNAGTDAGIPERDAGVGDASANMDAGTLGEADARILVDARQDSATVASDAGEDAAIARDAGSATDAAHAPDGGSASHDAGRADASPSDAGRWDAGEADCDPLRQTGCPATYACYVQTADGAETCAHPTVMGSEGASCARDSECLPGKECLELGEGRMCYRFCDVGTPEVDCPGRMCTDLGIPGHAGLGVCTPPP